MNLLISGNGQVLGQTYSADNAQRHAMVARDRMFALTKTSDIDALPPIVIENLCEEYRVIEASTRKLWNALAKKNFPYWGKVSVQRVVRTMYANGKTALTKDELMDMVPGATWISITTAFSMLKNKKYASGKVVVIEKIDGKYRRKPNGR